MPALARKFEFLVATDSEAPKRQARVPWSIRLSQSELERLEVAARRAGMTIGEFIRTSALQAAAHSSGAPVMTFDEHHARMAELRARLTKRLMEVLDA